MPVTASETIGLALGSGGARGIAHIVVLEALDDLDLRPSVIAGSSIGAIAGAAYSAGMSGADLRSYLLERLASRVLLVRDVMACRASGLENLFSLSKNPVLLDAARVAEKFLPEAVPARFEDLDIPLITVATDFYGRCQRIFESGALAPALAASMAIPGVFRPVELDSRLLVDGGLTNPLPFDLLDTQADIVIAVNVNGAADAAGGMPAQMPRPIDALFASVQIMAHAITDAKIAHYSPAIVLSPKVEQFRVLDFLQAEAILAASEPLREELKRALDVLLGGSHKRLPDR